VRDIGGSGGAVEAGGDAEELEDLALWGREFGVEDLDGSALLTRLR
jgi:hypothetical protein